MDKHADDGVIHGIKKYLILFNVTLSTFMATLDGSIVNIALPVISGEFGVSISSIQWVVTAYLLVISVLLLVWGRLSDLYGKKMIFASGFFVFALGSALCALSRSLEMLVLFRILQAVGASAMMALSQGIVTRIFPPNERGKALGITGVAVSLGSLTGPSLGGVLVRAAGWQSIFWINLPIGLLGLLLTLFLIPDQKPVRENEDASDKKPFDLKGALLFILAVLLFFTGLLSYQDGQISLLVAILMLVGSGLILALFIRTEKRTASPLIDLSLFRLYEFSTGLGAAYLVFVALNTTLLFMPFYLQYILKLNTLEAGILISFYPLATAIVAPISGALSDRITYKPLTVAGLLISTAMLVLLSFLGVQSSRLHIALIMTLLGVGGALFQSPNNSSVMGAVPVTRLGIAGGINALFRNLGLVSGTTFSVILFTFSSRLSINSMSGENGTVDTVQFMKGFRIVLLFAAAVSLAAMLLSFIRATGKGRGIKASLKQ